MSETLSQDEINALLSGGIPSADEVTEMLTAEQRDILGEIGNISMGTSATTMSTLLNQPVNITTPEVKTMSWSQISAQYDRPCVGVKIEYTIGLTGTNVLILKNSDVKIITDLMMGGSGEVAGDEPLTEIDMSAIGEAMNQMMGSSSTSLANFVGEDRIDITTPKAFQIDFEAEEFAANFGFSDDPVAVINFKLIIGDLLESNLMQVYPIEFAKGMVSQLMSGFGMGEAPVPDPVPEVASAPPQPMQPQASVADSNMMAQQQQPMMQQQPMGDPNTMYQQQPMMQQPMGDPHMMYQQQPMMQQPMGDPNMMYQQPMYPQQPMYQQQPMMQPPNNFAAGNVNATPAQFQTFDPSSVMQQKENIDILMDVPLEVTVELGRTSKRIKEILEFSPGTIIELDKLAGEPIDILVNRKYVAKGEVVVIDENFGIRVTSIISPEYRI